ncbi:MAG: DNA gyrase inhibitor YacG [Planctomycetota bacterium]
MIKSPSCPICGKPIDDPAECRTLPFCSSRCRQMDFFRWWDGRYAVVEDLGPMPPDGTGPAAGRAPGFDVADLDDPELTDFTDDR